MKIKFKPIFVLFIIFFNSNYSIGQTNSIEIKFIGNCGLYMTDGNLNIYADFPYKSGAFGYMTYNETELDSIKENSIFLFTHKHPDHYSKKYLKPQLKTKNGKKYGKWNISKLEKISQTFPEIEIQFFKTKHRFSMHHYSYLIIWHGKRIYLSGDTENPATIQSINTIDLAFIPYWIMYDANDNLVNFDAKMKLLYHLYPNEKIYAEIPENLIILDKQNKIIELSY